jgi:hypothetical protein
MGGLILTIWHEEWSELATAEKQKRCRGKNLRGVPKKVYIKILKF